MQEKWKDIEGYEGLYKVSNYGRIKSLNYGRTGREKVLKPGKDTKGYLFINLCKNRKRSHCSIHRLVAQAFILNTDSKATVNHIDGDKANNHVENLEWATYSENMQHAFETGLKVKAEKAGKPKKPVRCIENGIVFDSVAEATWFTGLDSRRISDVCNEKLKITDGLHFEFV